MKNFNEQVSSSKIDELIAKDNCTLEDLLEEEELLQEVKSGNRKLMEL